MSGVTRCSRYDKEISCLSAISFRVIVEFARE
jgi:hypothetical protein